MSVLEDIYYGNICPSEKYIRRNSSYWKKNRKVMENIDVLSSKIGDENKKLLEAIVEALTELSSESEKECFIRGLSLGIKLMTETVYYQSEDFQ